MPKQGAHLTVGQLSERSGVATSALRYYESHGLIDSDDEVAPRGPGAVFLQPSRSPGA